MTFSALCFSFSLMGCIISCILVDETFIVKNYHWWCNFCRLFTEDASLQSAYAGWTCLKQPILLDFDPGPFLLQLFYLPSYTYCTPKPLAGHLSLEQSILLKCIPCYGGIKQILIHFTCAKSSLLYPRLTYSVLHLLQMVFMKNLLLYDYIL